MPKSSPKPAKPCKDFPLFAHSTGQWAKKIRGKMYYFGVWANPDAALAKYLEQKDWLQAGQTPPHDTSGTQIAELCNRFLTAKKNRVDSGELAAATWNDYHRTCELVIATFGKHRSVQSIAPTDFAKLRAKITSRFGPVRTSREITQVRTLFKWGHMQELIDPPRFGAEFVKPSKDVLRRHRQQGPSKMFEADEIRSLLNSATDRVSAWVLLGINGAFIQSDIAQLPVASVNLKSSIIDFPRKKTAIERRVPLWPETIDALHSVGETPSNDDGLYFHTSNGKPLLHATPGNARSDAIHNAFQRLQVKVGVKRPGRSFGALRHTFRTIADETCDHPAILRVMGHSDNTISDHYRERISDDRLRKVVDHVRNWLFSEKEDEAD